MKKVIISICILVTHHFGISQQPFITKIATYTFKFEEKSGNSVFSDLLFESLIYIVETNGFVTTLKTSDLDSNNPNIHKILDGPRMAVYDISKNLVKFDENTDTIFTFLPVNLKGNNKEVIINGYKCFIQTTKNNDTLYLSKTLKSEINPFFLNNKSIKYGIVKATIKNSGTFTLNKITTNRKKILIMPKFNKKATIKITQNIFFKS